MGVLRALMNVLVSLTAGGRGWNAGLIFSEELGKILPREGASYL